MPHIVVTGAAGFIGSHTVDVLLANGHTVTGVDNFRTGKAANLASAHAHPAFRFYHADVSEPGCIASLLSDLKPHAIIHLAALVSVPESIENPELNHLLNFAATGQVIAAAHSIATIERIVFASSAAVYGNSQDLPLREASAGTPVSPYGQAKFDSEHLLQAAAEANPRLSTACLRYFNVYGPRQDPSSAYSGVISRFAAAFKTGRQPTLHGDGEQTRDFVAVADVARANMQAATKPFRGSIVVNVCTGRSISLNQLTGEMARLLQCPCAPTYGPARAGDIRSSLGAPEAAAQHLDFRTQQSLTQGLSALLCS